MYKIALLTPLHPQKTGIADYIEELLPYLRNSFNGNYVIDIFIENCVPSNDDTVRNHAIHQMDDFENLRGKYDLYIYQIGNNNFHLKIIEYALKYPGIIVMHDFAIHHVMAYYYLDYMKNDTAYFQAVEDNHGKEARDIAFKRAVEGMLGLWETDAINYPMNVSLAKKSCGVIVFSKFARERLEKCRINVPIHQIYLHCSGKAEEISKTEKESLQRSLGLGIANNEVLISVFGFITPSKRPYSILKAMRILKDRGYKVKVAFVGQLTDSCRDFKEMIKEEGLENDIHLVGFATEETFDHYLRASDICVSLRYPTMGETSGVLMRALRYGKPSIITNVGTFKEIPDKVAVKIPYGHMEVAALVEKIQEFIEHPEKAAELGKNALEYAVTNLEPQKTADSFAAFIKTAIRFNAVKDKPVYYTMKKEFLSKCVKSKTCDISDLDRVAMEIAEAFTRGNKDE